jgi:ferredoxin
MAAGLRVEVIRERCMSTQNCVTVAPGFFGLDEEGIATFTGEAGPDSEEAVRNAVEECPLSALRLVDP